MDRFGRDGPLQNIFFPWLVALLIIKAKFAKCILTLLRMLVSHKNMNETWTGYEGQ